MRLYTLPPDTQEEEKTIGGLITMKQFFWLIGGFISALAVAVVVGILTGSVVISMLYAIVTFALSTPFAFYKKYDMDLYSYLKLKIGHLNKTHQMVNKRNVKRKVD